MVDALNWVEVSVSEEKPTPGRLRSERTEKSGGNDAGNSRNRNSGDGTSWCLTQMVSQPELGHALQEE